MTNIYPKIAVSVFWEAGYFALYPSYGSALVQCFIYKMFRTAMGLSHEPQQSLIGTMIAEIRALPKL
jgi:hypothetical protein